MRVLSADNVRAALPMGEAIKAMKRAFAAFSAGRAQVPERIHMKFPEHDGVSLVMPAAVTDESDEALAVKVVSLFGGNPGRGLARINAAVLAIEPDTGRPIALLEGATLTAIRTAAASGAATDLLARGDSRTAAILGAGVQGRAQLEAVCTVRDIRAVSVYDPRREQAEAFAADLAGLGPIPADIRSADSAAEAVAGADVVCTATTAVEPVFADADLAPGVHINAIGSYQPGVREVPPETVCRAAVYVDSREAALVEAGDLIQPIRAGLIRHDHIRAELGEILLYGPASGRPDADVTLFKSVGIAVQDALAARVALAHAERSGLGSRVAW